jgi:hypothetical protein
VLAELAHQALVAGLCLHFVLPLAGELAAGRGVHEHGFLLLAVMPASWRTAGSVNIGQVVDVVYWPETMTSGPCGCHGNRLCSSAIRRAA